jgi:hypothetical protein
MIGRIIAFLFVLFGISPLSAKTLNTDSLRFEILLTSKMLEGIHVCENLSPSIDFTSNQLIMLSTSNQFYLLGWGGIVPIGEKTDKVINSFSYTYEGQLLAVCNNEICYVDSLGNLSKLFVLPSNNMGIMAGEKLMYVYDRNKDRKSHSVFAIDSIGNFERWLVAPNPVTSVIEYKNLILISTGNLIFSFNPLNKELIALLKLNEEEVILSMAYDEQNNLLYFSTNKAIYNLSQKNYRKIIDAFGGVLRYFWNSLFVLDTEKKMLIRIIGIDKSLSL